MNLRPIYLVIALVLDACTQQPAPVTVEQARQTLAGMSQQFPPPRTITDITAILDQEKPDPQKIAAQEKAAEAEPSVRIEGLALAKFYDSRAVAAYDLGRIAQALADERQAYTLARPFRETAFDPNANPPGGDYAFIAQNLGRLEAVSGNSKNFANLYNDDIIPYMGSHTRTGPQAYLFSAYRTLATESAANGDFDTARSAVDHLDQLKATAATFTAGNALRAQAYFAGNTNWGHGDVALSSGKFAEAASYYRSAASDFAEMERATTGRDFPPPGAYADLGLVLTTQLALALTLDGKAGVAEIEARRGLLDSLRRHGRYSVQTASLINALARVIIAQGRFRDGEILSREGLETRAKIGMDEASIRVATDRSTLISALVAERRWTEARQEYELFQKAATNDTPELSALRRGNLDMILTALHGGKPQEAVKLACQVSEERARILGADSFGTAQANGVCAAALLAAGDRAGAHAAFATAMPVLLGGSPPADDASASSTGAHDTVLTVIIEGYLALLAADPTPENAAEAFRAADLLRGQSVLRAVAAASAREGVKDPQLAALVRQLQDAENRASALTALLANGYAEPDDQRDDAALAKLRSEIDRLDQWRKQLLTEIDRRFPDYAQLTHPRPATVAEARAAMSDGEAMLATYVAEDRTYVWAVPKAGAIAFATAPLSRLEIEAAVTKLRRALDPQPSTLGDIPEFDLAVAHRLYEALLGSVKTGWQGAKNLLVVPHRALGQIPFSLLVTAPASLAPLRAGEPLFANYKSVPWLIRDIAVTQLPSVTSLTTLRRGGAPTAGRRPFVGFGDPWFTADQEEAAKGEATSPPTVTTEVASRGLDLLVRAPQTETMATAGLSDLPRLPDTVEEVRDVAASLHADLKTDVFLGAAANEETVRTTKLDDRRVVMFATHGLVAGDLDGLTEPALALTAPDIAHVPGDGLLTMSKILGLRLNADWVVLSACNTAAGNGAGADAVSGLGLAFFYAGARVLLVSNWPVETSSARLLTTGLFEREAATPALSHAEALRQSELALIDSPGFIDKARNRLVYSYAHPIFWAPFSVVGDGGANSMAP